MIARIYTTPQSGLPMISYRQAELVAGKGIAGDRYFLGTGHYSGESEWDAQVTLAQIEPVEEMNRQHGLDFDPRELRRNLLTRGIDVMDLIGREFQIGGTAVLRGRKAWPPCAHLVKTYGRVEIFKFLARDCGIGADVVVGGTVILGDEVTVILPES